MESKKISFGFSKLSKKTNIISNNVKQAEKKVELIECLEGQSIKVKDAIEEVKQQLIIPIKDNQKNLLDRIRDSKKRDRTLENKTETEDNRPDSELSVDELAARQLIREAKIRLAQGHNRNENKVSVLPLNQETPSLEGEKESTLEDYESVPISDYGLALLRGMGWKEGMTVGKNSSKTVSVSVPELRPKGLGLGATKVVQSEIPTKKAVDKDGKELILVKGAYAKLIAGVKKGNYCEVQGFDEDAGRVIVKVYPKGDNLNVNEFMLIPVTKEEFSKGSKILNNAKYEEYLEISDRKLEKFKIKQEPSNSKNIKEEYTQSSDSDSEENIKDATKNKKCNKELKDFPISNNERDLHSRQRDNHVRNEDKSELSDNESKSEKLHHSHHTKSKYRDRSRSRSPSRHKSKRDKNRRRSESDPEYYEKEKKSSKHSKSKHRDRSEDKSRSREKRQKDKKHKSKNRRESSSSESDSKMDKRKKNKCKSRHRRNSSSSSTDRKNYRSKKL